MPPLSYYQGLIVFPISRPALGGFVEHIAVDPSGVVRIMAWFETGSSASAPPAWLDDEPLPFLQQYIYPRNDLPSGATGVIWEYLVPEAFLGEHHLLDVEFGWPGEPRTRFEDKMTFVLAHHRPLLDTNKVLHREQIYGPGPPNVSIHPDVLAAAKKLPGPVLDFGCGRGLLVAALRASGMDAHGLELDSPVIRACAPPDVTLYDGRFPTPLETGRFSSVVCSEVLEHIPDFEGALREIARLTGEQAFFTVPDASAIPLGFQHGAVPWHLLESTHVNFFNQQSFARILAPHFRKIEFGRIGETRFNDTPYFVSLTALCWK